MRHLLVDADILVYRLGHAVQSVYEWPTGDVTFHARLEPAVDMLNEQVAALQERHAADAVTLILSHDSGGAHRNAVGRGIDYKGNRRKVGTYRPVIYKALRRWLLEQPHTRVERGLEGDDLLSILATEPTSEERLVVSVDKDLQTVPGFHTDFNSAVVWRVDIVQAEYAFLCQALAGDPSDNYPGCPKIGPKRAEKILRPIFRASSGPEDFLRRAWPEVVRAYEAEGLSEEDALANARCARLLRWGEYDFETKEVTLWTPPSA